MTPRHVVVATLMAIFALPVAGDTARQIPRHNVLQAPKRLPLVRMTPKPDLVVGDVRLDADCRYVVTLENRGNGSVPAEAYLGAGSTLAFRKNNRPYGEWGIGGLDKDRTLMMPGARVEWTRPSPRHDGTAMIQVTVDRKGTVNESNDGNNTLTRELTCAAKLPDLMVEKVEIGDDCRPRVTLGNAGEDRLWDASYSPAYGSYLQRFVDGLPAGQAYLGSVDPSRSLQGVGGSHTWQDGGQYVQSSTVEYRLSRLGQERSRDNNSGAVHVPEKCAKAVPSSKPDIAVTGIATTATCGVAVTLENKGAGTLGFSAYDNMLGASVQFYEGSKAHSGWRVGVVDNAGRLRAPGGKIVWVHPSWKISGSSDIRVVVDGEKVVPESDETNNALSTTLSCSQT